MQLVIYKVSLNLVNLKITFYLRCLKPNDKKEADLFEENFLVNQVKYNGIFSLIKFRQNGFPYHYEYNDFLT